MRSLIYIFSGLLFISSISYAQLTVKDQESSPNTLMQVIDEGSAGSIFLPPVGSSLTGTRLYNYGDNLFWGSNQLGLAGSAGGWTDSGSVVYTTSSSDKVGIGVSTPPYASLQVDGVDGVLFTGTYESGTIPIEGTGIRMMWYPKKAAFRVGTISTFKPTAWNDENIGENSVAMGKNTQAKGDYSTSIGYITESNANFSTAMGYGTKANGYSSLTLGNHTEANGEYSIVMGYQAKADARESIAIGTYNLGGGDPNSWVPTDPLFEIGNGTFSERANALTVLKNGKVGIGIHTPAHRLQLHETSSSYSYLCITNETTGIADGNGVMIGIDPDEDFRIHSYEDNNIKFYINNSQRMIIHNSGNVGIGTSSPNGKLDVDGSIYQRGTQLHADYVFQDDYHLESIKEHSDFMWREKHLPAIPKAKVDEKGREIVEVGSHRRGIVEELEKAHIYISQLEERLTKLEKLILDK